jgi:hypothetical protein
VKNIEKMRENLRDLLNFKKRNKNEENSKKNVKICAKKYAKLTLL